MTTSDKWLQVGNKEVHNNKAYINMDYTGCYIAGDYHDEFYGSFDWWAETDQ